jgi:GT2 family glycosyltransferase
MDKDRPVLEQLEPGEELAEDVLLYWRPSKFDAKRHSLAITIPTYRRPEQVLETIASVSVQAARHNAVIIIIENEAEDRHGAQAAARLFAAKGIDALVLLALKAGNCNAYNAGWGAIAHHLPAVQWVAVLDDDETAAEDWLDKLFETQAATGADLVGGPQIAVPPTGSAGALHPVFRPAYRETGPVPVLFSSGNLLMRRAVLDAMPQPFLDPDFNFTGGGDSDFYDRARRKGFRFAWANDAVLHEPVPPRRMEKDWIRARAYRNGALSTIIELRRGAGLAARAGVLMKSLALLALSPLRAAADLLRTGSTMEAGYRMQIGIGRLLGHFGVIHEQYRRPENN